MGGAMSKKAVVTGNLIKEINHKKILQLIGRGECLTKLDIAYALNISIPTVATNINELKKAGIIDEIESQIYTGGRKPKVIKLIPNARISLGVSITKYRISVIGLNLLNDIVIDYEVEFEGKEFEDYIIKAKKVIEQAIQEIGAKPCNILGVGLAIPGIINKEKGIIEQLNIGNKIIELQSIYDAFGYDVYIENEANLSLLAEKTMSDGEAAHHLIYICINESISGGIFINGQLFTGTNGRAGNLGQMRLLEKETGTAYKVEDYICARSLVARYKQRTGENIKSFLKFEKLFQLNDKVAHEILEEGIEVLMMTIYNLTMVLDIQRLIIGGKVGRLIKSQTTALQLIVNKYNEMMERLDLDITFSEIKNTMTKGAALLPLMEFYKCIENEK